MSSLNVSTNHQNHISHAHAFVYLLLHAPYYELVANKIIIGAFFSIVPWMRIACVLMMPRAMCSIAIGHVIQFRFIIQTLDHIRNRRGIMVQPAMHSIWMPYETWTNGYGEHAELSSCSEWRFCQTQHASAAINWLEGATVFTYRQLFFPFPHFLRFHCLHFVFPIHPVQMALLIGNGDDIVSGWTTVPRAKSQIISADGSTIDFVFFFFRLRFLLSLTIAAKGKWGKWHCAFIWFW